MNPHTSRYQNLNLACLPISPHSPVSRIREISHGVKYSIVKLFIWLCSLQLVEEASGIDLEFPNGALLRVKEKTSISITSILSQEDTQVEIALNRGKIFSKIKNKLKERDFYRILYEPTVKAFQQRIQIWTR